MTASALAAGLALVAIAIYAVFGGADFGGGAWDLLAFGPRRAAQRATITNAIGPVWEANHVWLIFAIVTLFTCFPPAFADLSIGLYGPLSLALLGIVLRGAAFVFRNYTSDAPRLAAAWSMTFGIASLLAPFSFGIAAGGLAGGRYAWGSPFALAVGLFAVVLCAQIAAVFLVNETDDPALREDFRRRAVAATVALWLVGLLPAAIARAAEPQLFAAVRAPAAMTAIAAALVLGLGVMLALARRAPLSARALAGAEVLAILGGWFGAQAPALVPGRYTLANAAAPASTLTAFLIAAALGMLLLIPSLWLLFAVFKGRAVPEGREQAERV